MAVDQAGGLEDIVVTARRRSENVQDTPVSISVATGDDLKRRSITKFTDLVQQAPSLRLAPAQTAPTTTIISLRGMSTIDARITGDTAVGIYVDGVYYPHAYGAAVGNFWDIDRVEVLKGPQGTLYGRNTTGGAVGIYSKTPTDKFGGDIKASVSNYAQYDLAGVVNVPVSTDLAVRVAADVHGHGAYGKNLFNGKDLGTESGQFVRATAKWNPASGLDIIVRADYGKLRVTPNAAKAGQIFPTTEPIPGGGFYGSTAAQEIALELGLLPITSPANLAAARAAYASYTQGDKSNGTLNVQPFDEVKNYGGSLEMAYEFSSAATLKSITGYRRVARDGAQDLDGTPFSIFELTSSTRLGQFSEELQLLGEIWKAKYIVGGYYSRESGSDFFTQTSNLLLTSTNPSIQSGSVVNKTIGFYGQTTIPLFDGLNTTLGIRYSKDNRSLVSHNRTKLLCTALGTPLASTPECSAAFSAEFSGLQWTAGLDYKITPAIMLYAKADRGYRTGVIPLFGGSTTPGGAAASYTPVDPATVDNYEIGIKAELFDRRVRANVTYYHAKFNNIQIARNAFLPGVGNISIQENGAKALVDGVEAELNVQPVQAIQINGSLAYTDARFTEYQSGSLNLVGFPLNSSPKWAYNLSGAYTVPTGVGDLRLQLDWSHRSRQTFSQPSGLTRANGILNGKTTLHLEERNIDLSLYMKNITDTRVANYGTSTNQGILYSGPYSDPRTFGAEVSLRF